MSFNLCSTAKTTPIIWRSQSLNCLSVWLGRKWIKTIRDGWSWPAGAGEIYFPSLPETTSSHTLDTGRPAVPQYISLSVWGHSPTDCLPQLGRKTQENFQFCSNYISLSTLSHSPHLGKTETEKTLMILSFFSSSLEQGHYLHLVYLVLTSFTHLLLDQAALCVSVRSSGLS